VAAGKILVGTSSWADPGFVKEWYPPKMAARERLPWYAQRFAYVELNSSFYAVPDRSTVHKWVQETPDDFVFDVKAHRLLSRHSAPLESLPPELREDARTTGRGRVQLTPELETALARRLVEETAPLAEAGKLGAYLVQLTPAFSPGRHELAELSGLVQALRPHRVAIELRNRNWAAEERLGDTLRWFADEGVAFVDVDAPADEHFSIMPSGLDAVTTNGLAYLRLHGRNADGYLKGKSVAERFGWEYSDEELEEIAGRARSLAEQADVVHVAFNNNRSANAPTSAGEFRRKLGQDPGPAAAAGGEQLRLA